MMNLAEERARVDALLTPDGSVSLPEEKLLAALTIARLSMPVLLAFAERVLALCAEVEGHIDPEAIECIAADYGIEMPETTDSTYGGVHVGGCNPRCHGDEHYLTGAPQEVAYPAIFTERLTNG